MSKVKPESVVTRLRDKRQGCLQARHTSLIRRASSSVEALVFGNMLARCRIVLRRQVNLEKKEEIGIKKLPALDCKRFKS